ncbi:Ig-like domain-containing protein [Paucibacter sp. AS339]|uniref:Ig-like domain-containing protein n=1 Tax=Paucibacter hankyongi TaxID=3133434 RepID=UPI00309A897E
MPLALALSACGGGGGSTPEPPKPGAVVLNLAVDEATLSWNKASSLKVLANDSASRGALSLSEVSKPANGTAKIIGSEIEYTPTAGYVGSDTFTYTAQGEDGSKATAAVNLKINAALLLKGVVSDGPIANAVVTANVGSKTFTATADAQGAYSLPVQTDSLSDSVQLSASGVGTQSAVKLTSLLGDMAALGKLADKDGQLSPAQASSTQVTHYSTALAALVKENNGSQAPSTLAKLEELSAAVSGDRLIELATAIKLVVDKGVALPAGVADTAALVANPGSAAALAAFLKTQQALPVYEATRGEVLAGPGTNQGQVFAPKEAQSQLYFVAELGRSALQRVDYRPDGSATIINSSGTREAKWTAKAGEIELTLLTPFSQSSFSAEPDATGQQYEVRLDTVGARFKQLAGGPQKGQVLVSLHNRQEVVSGSNKGKVLSDDWSFAYPASSQDLRSLAPTQASDFPVGARFPGIFVESELKEYGQGNTADIMVINGAGTATLLLSGVNLTWSIVDGQLVTFYPNGAERRYSMLRENLPGDLVLLMATDYSKGLPQRALPTLATRMDSPQGFIADAGLYKRWYSRLNPSSSDKFGFEFRAGGTGLTLNVFNGVESNQALSWSIKPDGNLRMLRGTSSIREWKLLARQGANLTVLESQQSASNGSITIPWRVAVYTDTSANSSGGAASVGQFLSVKGEKYPLRVNFTLDSQGKITGGDFDFHGVNGSMEPCTWSQANTATCFGTNGSITPKVQQGGPLLRESGSANSISLIDGPNDYGYTFTGTLTGLIWTGTWTKVATAIEPRVDSGTFSVKVGIR